MIVLNLLERLRPLVGFKNWDYCVVWKLSDDQRFLEWVDCCCGGNESVQNGGELEEMLFPVSPVLPCRDALFQHPRTKPCNLLSQLPSSIPLDSGIHAQALISNQPRWVNFPADTHSSLLDEIGGTRALVPVPGGLIDLFVDKQVAEDQAVVDFVMEQCTVSLGQEAMINSTNMDATFASLNASSVGGDVQKDLDTGHFQSPDDLSSLPYHINVDRIRLCSSPMNFLQQISYAPPENHHLPKGGCEADSFFLEGSDGAFQSQKQMEAFKSPSPSPSPAEAALHDSIAFHEQQQQQQQQQQCGHDNHNHSDPIKPDSISDCSDQVDDEDDLKYRRRGGKGQSKNLMAERKRRKKLNDRLYALRSLVPRISKLDRASILGDAIEYVKELQMQVKELHDELEDARSDDDESGPMNSVITNRTPLPCRQHQHHESEITSERTQQMEVQVEVAQIDGNEFFVKILCEHKPGGFARLMEALDSLGLEITNANVTSFRCLVSNVFKVEKRDSEMVQADHVRESLLELTRNPCTEWAEVVNAQDNNNNADNGADYHHHIYNNHHISSHNHLHGLHS